MIESHICFIRAFNITQLPQVSQISGISRQYHQDFFKSMNEEVGIDLENIVYYRGETHYFVMTALRKSLIEKGVILSDSDDRKALLAPTNINRYCIDVFSSLKYTIDFV